MKTISLVCSLLDDAGINIRDRILEAKEWSKTDLPAEEKMTEALKLCPVTRSELYPDENRHSNFFTEIYEFRQNDVQFYLLTLDGRLLFQDELDKRLSFMGFESDLIVFLSKHKSKSETKSLTVHPTGNCAEALYGGYPRELNVPAPFEMKKLLLHMDRQREKTVPEYDVTFEVTHHGPTRLSVPSLFIEIGSSEPEWKNKTAGKVVADAVLSLAEHDAADMKEMREMREMIGEDRYLKEKELQTNQIVAVGFGGSHYGERQTVNIFKTRLAFGHMFPKYQLETLTEDVVVQAFEKTGTKTAFFDKNSMKSQSRQFLTEIINKHGFRILTDKEVKEEYGVGFNLRDNENENKNEK
jgi:D-aminoacyl-tRNA deacylase